MIQRQKKRLVLFLPHRADPEQGVRVAADLLPLELLQIAAIPAQEGYEIHVVDAMIHEDYMRRLLELCDGALLFASSCILGFQVAHGARVAKVIREKFPELPIIHGGWFPSVSPEIYIEEGIADAVGLGQGEITFWEFVQAVENGTSLEDVPGLVIERDGKPHYTAHRPIVGFDQIPDVPWDLLEFEEYVKLQNDPHEAKLRHRLPDPHDYPKGVPYRTFSYFSSFGCPEPCTFCCSPMVTGRRWKAIPGKLLFERLEECRERFNFNQVRFQDANFGVSEKRSNEYCEQLIEAGKPYWWNATYEIETIARYKEESVDKMADAGCHLCILGAEAGTEEQQTRIKKKIDLDNHLELALSRLYDRKIQTGTTWIIGYPGETPGSMLATLNMAARMKHNYPGSASDVFPFRPIAGTEDFNLSVELGYEPPKTLEEWGACLEYKAGSDATRLPHEVMELWRRYGATATFYDGLESAGSSLVRGMLKSISGWRLRHGRYGFPLEQKLFDIYVRLTRQSLEDQIQHDRTSGVTPHPVQS